MKPSGTLPPSEETDSLIVKNIEPITRVEIVSIDDSLARVLAEDIIATKSIPPFDRATVDGYAVIARDTLDLSRQKPKIFNLVDILYAGAVSMKKLAAGECIQIATGAKMPHGADAVVMIEDTSQENGYVKIYRSVSPGANVAPEGGDIKKGELVLKQGSILDPASMGVLASQGLKQVRVYEKPRVAIISTGDELSQSGERLKLGQIYDINSYTISAIVTENGCLPLKFGIVGDNPQQIRAIIESALDATDLVVVSGGSSVGERDFISNILQNMGNILPQDAPKKEGNSKMFALVNGKPVLGMPGYPSSCLINAYLFLTPALRKMAHLPAKRSIAVNAKLSEKIQVNTKGRHFILVKVDGDNAVPIFKDWAAITSIAEADGYIVIDEKVDLLEKGEPVMVTLF
jgi:molybdopterin molybdotransferase